MTLAPEKKLPWKICRAGGREFEIYRKYDDFVGYEIGIYPDFRKHPEYTAEGRPFATAADDACLHGKPRAPEDDAADGSRDRYSSYGDCGGCAYFYREETPWDIIGVCMCEALRREPGTK